MAQYAGSALALGALSRAIGESLDPLMQGLLGSEQVRRGRVAEARDVERLGLAGKEYGLREASERRAAEMDPLHRRLLGVQATAAERALQPIKYEDVPGTRYFKVTDPSGKIEYKPKPENFDAAMSAFQAVGDPFKNTGAYLTWAAQYPETSGGVQKALDSIRHYQESVERTAMQKQHYADVLKQGFERNQILRQNAVDNMVTRLAVAGMRGVQQDRTAALAEAKAELQVLKQTYLQSANPTNMNPDTGQPWRPEERAALGAQIQKLEAAMRASVQPPGAAAPAGPSSEDEKLDAIFNKFLGGGKR